MSTFFNSEGGQPVHSITRHGVNGLPPIVARFGQPGNISMTIYLTEHQARQLRDGLSAALGDRLDLPMREGEVPCPPATEHENEACLPDGHPFA